MTEWEHIGNFLSSGVMLQGLRRICDSEALHQAVAASDITVVPAQRTLEIEFFTVSCLVFMIGDTAV